MTEPSPGRIAATLSRGERVQGFTALVFLSLFLLFSAWALLRPPFQAPDEFWHVIRCWNTASFEWIQPDPEIEFNTRHYNPLVDLPRLHDIAYLRIANDVTIEDVVRMKQTAWITEPGKSSHTVTAVYSYPPLYYAIIQFTGGGLTRLFSLSPYSSFYAYALASAFLSALLWTLVFLEARRHLAGKPWPGLLLSLVLIPMIGFLSSSVNPDAAFIPLSALALLLTSRALDGKGGRTALGLVLLIAAFIKPSIQAVIPALGIVIALSAIASKEGRPEKWRLLLIPSLAWVIAHLFFYKWSPAALHPVGGVPKPWSGPLGYLPPILLALPGTVKEYWGKFGWLSFSLPKEIYYVLYSLAGLNLFYTWRDRKEWIAHCLPARAVLFSFIFYSAIIYGQLTWITRSGLILQGRYFLPAALGFAMFLWHRAPLPKAIFLGWLGLMNLLFIPAAINHWYGGDWSLWMKALPWMP